MTIEWGGLPLQSNAQSLVLDPAGQAPTNVIRSTDPFRVRVTWTVPPGLAPYIAGQFRLRAFAESVGNGQEQQIGQTLLVNAVPNQTTPYVSEINVAPPHLLGEGVNDGTGQPVSGLYRIATVLQHLNPGPTPGSGFTDETLVQIRTP